MRRKMTIVVDDAVYQGLQEKAKPGQISAFVEDLLRPHVVEDEWRFPTEVEPMIATGAARIRELDPLDYLHRTLNETLD
jgi:hypothetical protein